MPLVEVVRSPTCASFVKRFLMRLSGTDVELVCEIQISTETVRHEHDGGDEAPLPSFELDLLWIIVDH